MPITRQVSLAHLPDFGRNLCDAFARAGIRDGDRAAVCEMHLNAKCAVCRIAVNGRALAPVLLVPDTPNPSATDALSRLRMGNCVDRACSSAFYEFTFAPHPAIDWLEISVTRPEEEEPCQPTAGFWRDAAQTVIEIVRRQLTRRVAIALAVLIALWMMRQWMNGGRIPVIREPKTYTGQLPPGAELQSNPDAN